MNTLQTILNTPPCVLRVQTNTYTHKYTKLRLLTAILLLLAIFLITASIFVWMTEFAFQQPTYFLKELRGVC